MNQYEQILEFARKAHEGQTRRDGKPYFGHIENVVKNTTMLYAEDVFVIAVAAFHDLIEDGRAIENEIRDFLNEVLLPSQRYKTEEIIKALFALTHEQGERYEEYIQKIKESSDKRIILVKIADILDNLSDNPSQKQREKYRRAIEILRS